MRATNGNHRQPRKPLNQGEVKAATNDAAPTLTLLFIEGGVWACAPVAERPELVLTDWRVFSVPLPGLTECTRHFVGYNVTEREGRVSSAIVQFDAATMRGVTKSGRVYALQGRPGRDGDGEYTWSRWKRINDVTDAEAIDVTAEVWGAGPIEERPRVNGATGPVDGASDSKTPKGHV
jgi:hypothetical protein